MPKPLVFRCPETGLRVHTAAEPDDQPERAGVLYRPIQCTACGKIHLVNPETGRLASEGGL